MKNKVFVSILAGIIGICTNLTSVNSAHLDAYRSMLANRSFTLKYEIVTPPTRRTNHAVDMEWGVMFDTKHVSLCPLQGIVVMEGDNRYTETTYRTVTYGVAENDGKTQKSSVSPDERSHCMLIKNGEVFEFYRSDFPNGKKSYDGRTSSDPYEEMNQEIGYGNPVITQLLEAIRPSEHGSFAELLTYNFQGTGSLSDGTSYEDYAARKDGQFYAMRYYFNHGQLVKVASATWPQNLEIAENGYEKCVIRITEVSSVPDQNYLSLPVGLKVVTKREK